ncbi:hypothetical protein [Candidatus Palauibacter sp.]|uniref:hypothetical protein n=1 Tax=Candidatus Palauibacter sp. TaxID=3101350 RepID=UPI003B024130
MSRFAILVDGDYMKKQLESTLKRFPTVQDFRAERRIFYYTADVSSMLTPTFTLSPGRSSVHRIFYYTADPYDGTQSNPLRGAINFATSRTHQQNTALIEQLEREDDVAVRRGVVVPRSGLAVDKPFHKSTDQTTRTNAALAPPPISVPISSRKASTIGLDIATLALKRLVTDIVVVTGDLDMVPAFKLARTEGLRVYVDMMGAGGRRKLRVHSDRVL